MNKLNAVLNRLPRYAYSENLYEINNTNAAILGEAVLGIMVLGKAGNNTTLYRFIKSIVDEFNITMNNIDRVDKMINIDTVLPDDIYNRFGALLNIKRNKNETDEQYRSRLKVSITSLSGGTVWAIKYAVASGLGINNDANAMDRIHVYDAWEYDGDAAVNKDYGYVVCSIDLNQGSYSTDMESIVAESANNVKAAGVVIQFVYYNYRISYYSELDNMTYASLDTSTYNQVGE